MQHSVILAILAASVSAQKITAAETDVGAILKSMDQSKLSGIPPTLRAVFVKMPENPEKVTAEDRAAIKNCITDANMDVLAKEAVSFCPTCQCFIIRYWIGTDPSLVCCAR